MTVQTEQLRKTDDVAYLECSFKLKKTSTSGTNCSIFLRLNRVNAITAQIRPMQDFCLLDFREVLLIFIRQYRIARSCRDAWRGQCWPRVSLGIRNEPWSKSIRFNEPGIGPAPG